MEFGMNGTVGSHSIRRGASPRPPADGEEAKIGVVRSCNEGSGDGKDYQIVMDNSRCNTPENPVMCTAHPGKNAAPTGTLERDSSECADSPPAEQGTPPYFKWAQNLQYLLNDIEGVELFQQYLKQEIHDTGALAFWFACEGLKKAEPKSKDYIQTLIKLINKKYVKPLTEISSETKNDIKNRIALKQGMDQDIFYVAQREVETVIMKTTYPNFLRSDIYLQHIQKVQKCVLHESPRNEGMPVSNEDSGDSSREGIYVLPTLHEDSELQIETSSKVPLTREALLQRNRLSATALKTSKQEAPSGHYLKSPYRSYNSCYAKYSSFLPTSAQDSELQSLSSDAQTDDTMSLADSTVGNGPISSHKNNKKHHRTAKYGFMNRDSITHNTFIPRTSRIPAECAVKVNPEEFAADLTDRLNRYLFDLKTKEKVNERLQKLEDSKNPSKTHDEIPCAKHFSQIQVKANTPQVSSSSAKEKFGFTEDSDQAILDQHVSRVWKDSAHQTPTRSPGHVSPPPAQSLTPTLGRRKVGPWGTSNIYAMPNVQPSCGAHSALPPGYPHSYKTGRSAQYMIPPHISGSSNRHKKDRDTYSSDSGTVHDFTPDNEPIHQFSHVHKNTHHYQNNLNAVGDQYSMMSFEHSLDRRSREPPKRSNSKKASMTDSSSSCVDSGISVVCDSVPVSYSTRERVANWLDPKKYSASHCAESDKDSSPYHKKSSHSSTSPVLSRASKKPVMYNSSRLGGETISYSSPHVPSSTGLSVHSYPYARTLHGGQPSQPVAQDPSMPILPPPDITTQLEEARRRLEDETRIRQDTAEARRRLEDESRTRQSKPKKSVRKSCPGSVQGSASVSISSNSDMTVVGYCFGNSNSVPFLTKLPGKNITLKQLKSHISKKGNFRYFFKKASNDFGTGVVFEEINDENEVLPLWEGKIFSVIEQTD